MFFSSPIWLISLAPWAGLVVWLLWGRLETTEVPFLELWRSEAAQNLRPRRAWRMPPLAMMTLLAAMLLAILAGSGPTLRSNDLPVAGVSSDVRIEGLTVRSMPTTQAMVRVVNESDLAAAKLTVRDGGAVVSEDVELPGRDQARNYFVDLPVAGPAVDAEISADAGNGIDHHLSAVRRAAWPVVESRGALPAELERMIGVYARHRPEVEGSRYIAVVAGGEDVALGGPTAVVMNSGNGALATIEPLIVRDGPLTRSVDWNRALGGAKVESAPPGEWQTAVSAAGIVVVAFRTEPLKEVWVGLDSEEFAEQADFVIFWSNVFDWLGDGGDKYQMDAAVAPATMLMSFSAAGKTVPLAGRVFLIALGLMIFSVLLWKAPKFTDGKGFQS